MCMYIVCTFIYCLWYSPESMKHTKLFILWWSTVYLSTTTTGLCTKRYNLWHQCYTYTAAGRSRSTGYFSTHNNRSMYKEVQSVTPVLYIIIIQQLVGPGPQCISQPTTTGVCTKRYNLWHLYYTYTTAGRSRSTVYFSTTTTGVCTRRYNLWHLYYTYTTAGRSSPTVYFSATITWVCT